MINKSWQLQDAKNRLSQLVNYANTYGPQIITRHGKETAVVLSFSEYKKMTKPESGLVDFFQKSPLSKESIEFERIQGKPREIEI